MRVCAVVPAAGRGSRLGLSAPKVFTMLDERRSVWNVIQESLTGLVEHTALVLSPDGEEWATRHHLISGDVSVCIQREPIGMGDAVFSAQQVFTQYDQALIIWGDQASVSAATLRRLVEAHQGGMSLPLAWVQQPYVQYLVEDRRLQGILEAREGDELAPEGLSDVGVFLLDAPRLPELWAAYLAAAKPGKSTQELNFLPFLSYLSVAQGWPLTVVPVESSEQTRGLNTPDDLAYFRGSH